MPPTAEQIEKDLLWPIFHTSTKYWIAVGIASCLVLAGVAAFGYQLYAGTLISAILRLCNATWRRPVTRCAEAITVFAILIGGIIPLCHIGRPWLAFWMIPYPNQRFLWPNFRSPLAWDFFAISTYLTGS